MNLPFTGTNFAAAKNTSSHYIWATHLTSQLFGFEQIDNLLGCRDSDIEQIVDMAEQFMQDDNTVMTKGSQTFIEKVNLRYMGLTDVLTTKTPFYDDDNQVGGVFFNTVLMKELPFQNLLSILNHNKKVNTSVNQIVDSDPMGKLSIRELEILFFTLRGKSAKAIAQNLYLSTRTIESHLYNIKNKFSSHSKQQLIECATHKGYMNLIPKTFVDAGYYRHEQLLLEK
jgi:DNA-binding CsgD family transcriptional regulator